LKIAVINKNSDERNLLSSIYSRHSTHSVIWTASCGGDGLAKLDNHQPDLILLGLDLDDINAPEVTRKIMDKSSCAILIISPSIDSNAGNIFESMGAGALDATKTPECDDIDDESVQLLLEKTKIIQKLITNRSPSKTRSAPSAPSNYPIVVIGASTGGPIVLAEILSNLPADYPHPLVIVQHVDEQFSGSFSNWLNEQSQLDVRIANNGDKLEAGTVLIAGTSDHLTLRDDHRVYYTENPKEYVYRPSVDVLFSAVAEKWNGKVLGVLLTGMGRDGAQGLLDLRNNGSHTISQEASSCAVYGMPKAAEQIKASISVESIDDIVDSILRFGNKTRNVVKSA